MKKRTIVSLALVAALAGGAGAFARRGAEPAQGKREVIIGEVIDIAGWMMSGEHGEEYAETARYRFEKGLPVGILQQETMQLFIPVFRSSEPASPLDSAREKLKPYVGKMVVTSGQVYRKNGTNFIRLQVIAEY